MPLGKEKSSQIDAAACDGASGYLSSIKEHAKNALIVLGALPVFDSIRAANLHRA
jgi:hypothetical protein